MLFIFAVAVAPNNSSQFPCTRFHEHYDTFHCSTTQTDFLSFLAKNKKKYPKTHTSRLKKFYACNMLMSVLVAGGDG